MRKNLEKPLLTEDHLIRMINMAVAALARAVGLRAAGQFAPATQAVWQALEEIVGLKPHLIHLLDDRVLLAQFVHHGSLDADRLYAVALLMCEEGNIFDDQGQAVEAYWSRLRALNFFLEIALHGGAVNFPPPDGEIEGLRKQIQAASLPQETVNRLAWYDDQAQ